MKLRLADIFAFGNCTPSSRNFVEGEHLLDSNHILKCGKVQSNSASTINILAYSLQTSNLKEKPHEIRVEIGTSGKIIKCICSCKAGLSQKCKHVLGVLLYCYKYNIDEFEDLSCTDVKCVWKNPQKEILQQYKGARVKDHECYRESYKGCDEIPVTDEKIEIIKKLALSLGETAYSKHIVGRHEVLEVINNNIRNEDFEIVNAIINNEDSEVMKVLSTIPVDTCNDCCYERLVNFYKEDFVDSCINSKHSLPLWMKLRQFRITGSRIYSIYTYSFNKDPDWEKKSLDYFYPKSFSCKQTEHGKKFEKVAIEAYEKEYKTKVSTCGLVISKLNAWMGYSPDGIVMKDNKPSILIEVKCPYDGRKAGISEIIAKQKYIKTVDEHSAIFSQKHSYYCQIQMGMAFLNVQFTDFIIFASHDNSFQVIKVAFNESYILNVFTVVKKTFCNIMLHYICLSETENIENGNSN